MKASIATAIMAPLLVSANGPGGGAYGRRGSGGGGRPGKGGPGGFGCGYDDDSCGLWGGDGCATSCFSSFWESATPTPTAFCDGNSGLHTCIESACDGDQDRFNSYSSRRSSLCSEFSTCESTGTYTYTYKTPDADWAGGRFSDRTWPTGEVVYTGCPWNGDGWGFPFWGGLGYGDDFWNGGRPGWNLATVTSTVAADSTSAVVTLEQAVSGDTTTFRTLGIEEPAETSQPSPNAAPGSLNGVKVVGAALGAVVVVAGML